MLEYLLKSGACLAIFLLFYKLVLERESIHMFKRYYLLGALIVSFIIPKIIFTEYVEIPAPVQTPIEFAQTTFVSEPTAIATDVDMLNLTLILWTIYGLGVVLFGFKFIKNLGKIVQRIRKNPKFRVNSITNVLLKDLVPPHTFFHFVFLNRKKFEARAIPEAVLLHEETHARQKHSIDVLFVELLQVLFWFNPLIYATKKAIKLNHEFLADQAVVTKGIATTTYQNILLAFSSNSYQPELVNSINYSSIKKRFTVMKKRTSKKAILLRSVFLLPLLALMVYGFSETDIVQIQRDKLYDSEIQETPSYEDELNNINALQLHYQKSEGATEKMMDEYRAFIEEFERTKTINYQKYQRIVAIYNLMTPVQKESVVKYPQSVSFDMSKINPKAPTSDQFEEFKSKEKHAIWINGKHVENIVLNQYERGDFDHFNTSFVHNNARSEKFPQEYQTHLYTSTGYNETFTKSNLNEYNKLLKLYKNELNKFNNTKSKDNSELRILNNRILSLYSRLSKEQKREYEIVTPPTFPDSKLSQEQILIGEVIEILINRKGQLLVKDKIVSLDELPSFLSKFNKDLSKKEREKVVRAVIVLDETQSGLKNVISDVESILHEYGVATINIVGPEDLPPLQWSQEGASRKQMAEYNKLAKHYNEMDSNHMKILKKDVERLKYIYNLMSDKQRADAEPFPDFPEPPPVPGAPKAPNEREEASIKIKQIIEEQDPYDVVGGAGINVKPTSPVSPRVLKGEVSNIPPPPPSPAQGPNVQSELPLPPILAYRIHGKDMSKELKRVVDDYKKRSKAYRIGVSNYSNDKKGSKESLDNSYNELIEVYEKFEKMAIAEGVFVQPPPPASPLKPMAPIDHVIEMTKKGATFYYEGKEINSDKAIEIVKQNDKINIGTTQSSNNPPRVELTIKGIVIEN